MAKRYFGTDGIRGRVGERPMTPDFVLKLGWAAGRVLAEGKRDTVLIGKDTRVSGYMFESALEAGLLAAGMNIRLLGPMPTPAVAYLTRTFRACAGIVITASHNPYYDNGIKFFSSQGAKLPDSLEAAIEAEIERELESVDSNRLGKAVRVNDAVGRYIEFCKATLPAPISLRGLRIAVDCANGATYHIAPQVLHELGAEVLPVAVAPNGYNINERCGATALEGLCDTVRRSNAQLGVAFDGDGDRLMMVDARGTVVDGDDILFILARARQQAGRLRGGVVGTQMSNLGLEKAMAEMAIPFQRTQVGDRYVLESLLAAQWELGGETSGHVICLDRTTTGDGIVTALQVLHEMVTRQAALHELCQGLTHYPQVLCNVPVARHLDLGDAAIQAAVTEAEQTLGSNGRVLLRASGTEPLIRVMVEGLDGELVRHVAERLTHVVANTATRGSGCAGAP